VRKHRVGIGAIGEIILNFPFIKYYKNWNCLFAAKSETFAELSANLEHLR